MSVLLPDPDDPDQRRRRSRGRLERHALEHGHARVVLEPHVLELDLAAQFVDCLAGGVLGVLTGRVQNLVDAIEARERLGDLRPDRRDLHDRHRQQRREEQVLEEVAERHRPAHQVATADENQHDRNRAEHDARERPHGRHTGHRLGDVAEELVRALREHEIFAALGGVGLDDADAAEGLIEASRQIGGEFPSLPEQRPQRLERVAHRAAEGREHDGDRQCQPPIEVDEDAERDDGREHAARELHEARADEIANAVRVVHHARDQHARLRRVEEPHGQPHDVRFDATAHVGDRLLGRDAKDLREPEGRGRLHQRGPSRDPRELAQEVDAALADDVIDQELGERRQHESGARVDEHQHEPERRAASGAR